MLFTSTLISQCCSGNYLLLFSSKLWHVGVSMATPVGPGVLVVCEMNKAGLMGKGLTSSSQVLQPSIPLNCACIVERCIGENGRDSRLLTEEDGTGN